MYLVNGSISPILHHSAKFEWQSFRCQFEVDGWGFGMVEMRAFYATKLTNGSPILRMAPKFSDTAELSSESQNLRHSGGSEK